MISYAGKPEVHDIVRLNGTIKNYRCTRSFASFIFTETNEHQLGAIAVAAAIVGMAGQAASMAGAASDGEEPADYIEFELGNDEVKGWVWRSPFRNGDEVAIAAQRRGIYYELFGIARPIDKTIALYPHCSRAKGRHIKNAIKWWLIFNLLIFVPLTISMIYSSGVTVYQKPEIIWIHVALIAVFIVMFTSLARQYMPFVRVAQKVFLVLDLPGPKNIDLVKSSNAQRQDTDPPEFGTFYFRY